MKIISVITILLMVLIQGCINCQYTKRQEWLDPKHFIIFELDSYREKGISVNKEFLIEKLGSPDHIVSPQEFKERLVSDDELSKIVIKRLVQPYLKAKDIEIIFFKNYDFYKGYEFDENCMLWLYDESMHFEKPVKPPMFTMCADVGFSCFCYYVEGDKVIGGTVFSAWKPLKSAGQ